MKLFPGSRGLATLAVVGLALFVAATAFATDTKHSATSGSFLINSNTQLNAFPHWSVARDAFVEVSSGATYFGGSPAGASDGSARLSVKAGNADWIFRANDQVTGSRLMQYAWGGTALYPSVTPTVNSLFFREGAVFDVDYARGMSNGGAFSLGGSLSLLKLMADQEVGAPADLKNTGFSVRGSWGNGNGQDIAAEVTFQKPQVEGVGDTDLGETVFDSWLSATAMYHGALQSGWVVNAAGFFMSLGDNDFQDIGGRDISSMIGLLASFGRLLMDNGSNQVGVEGYVEYRSKNWEGVYQGNPVPGNAIVVPGMRLGLCQELGGAFHITGGAHAAWQSTSFSADDLGGGEDRSTQMFSYDYTLGLGATWGRVTVETQVHPESIPRIVSLGNDRDVLAMASVNVALN